MTEHDLELLDLASSTGYRDTILRYIDEADSEECKRELRAILEDPDIRWEQ